MQRISPERLAHRLLPAACLLLLLAHPVAARTDDSPGALAATATAGLTIAVANCNDSGPGSLRNAIAGAASGDTIDMSSLACRKIDLTSGAIEIAQQHLSIVGGPPGLMRIDAGRRSSVFRHSGTGWLRIKRLNIANGFYSSSTRTYGGCLYSAGKIELFNSNVHGCRAKSTSAVPSRGGGIFAWGSVRLVYTWVTGNTAIDGLGGGIVAYGGLRADHSHISNNRADSRAGVYSQGGLRARYSTFSNNHGRGTVSTTLGDLIVTNSTFSGNNIQEGWPVIAWGAEHGFGSASIIDSTISGNTSSGTGIVGLYAEGAKSIVNSTIAFNQSTGSCDDPNAATVIVGTGSTLLDSTIISNNSCDGAPQSSVGRHINPGPFALMGANNLITAPASLELPLDTITADPRLAPLADNGGPTRTHAVPADSPAIDSGNNAAGLGYDQRGPGYPRVNGLQADIGAYER